MNGIENSNGTDTAAASSRRILVVEDDIKMAELLRCALTNAGFSVECAFDGQSGFEAASTGNFEALVADIMMPVLDGIGMIGKLRGAGIHTPVIVLSALGSVENKILGLESGCDDYLEKPFSVAELIARVNALIRRSASPDSTVISCGDLVVDLVSGRVTRAGCRIDLQPLEHQLLVYMLRNKGRVVSKSTIMEHVWGYKFDTGTNIVESRMCHLRDKIDRPFDKALIKTVRGFGYVLE